MPQTAGVARLNVTRLGTKRNPRICSSLLRAACGTELFVFGRGSAYRR